MAMVSGRQLARHRALPDSLSSHDRGIRRTVGATGKRVVAVRFMTYYRFSPVGPLETRSAIDRDQLDAPDDIAYSGRADSGTGWPIVSPRVFPITFRFSRSTCWHQLEF